MKKILFLAALLCTAIAFTACKTGGEDTEAPNVSGVTLNKTTLTVAVGDGEILQYTVTPAEAEDQSVTWSSSDPTVATVDERGMVEGVKTGTAVITVTTTDGGKTATCTVTVVAEIVEVTGITLAPATAKVEISKTTTLVATVMPENASDKTVTWATSDATVATVAGGVVTGVKAGTATITATASNGDEATCAVTVEAVSEAVKFRLPDFARTKVYFIKNGDKTVGEVTVEYVPEFSKGNSPTVVYPYNNDGKPDYTKGYVVNNGGSISWDGNNYTYTKGTANASLIIHINEGTVTTASIANATEVTPTPFIFKDSDNNEYGIVKIASQYWLQSNLQTKKLPNGSSLEAVNGTEPAKWLSSEGCYAYYGGQNEDDYQANYGLLYNYKASLNIAPEGWHVPSETEWAALNTFLAVTPDGAGVTLRDKSDTYWASAIEFNSANRTYFNAVGAGFIGTVLENASEIPYKSFKEIAAWYTSTSYDKNVISYTITYNSTSLNRSQADNTYGMSIRLVRD